MANFGLTYSGQHENRRLLSRNDLATEGRTKLCVFYETCFTPGGCHVPSPAGRIEGGVGFGQYRRITR